MAKKPTYEELEQRVKELEKEGVSGKRSEQQIQHLNPLKEQLLGPGTLEEKLKRITDGVVEIFDADFCRTWIIKSGDLCDSDCFNAWVTEGPHVCRYRERCLHLMASSGRYTNVDGRHGRVPFGCYKIGRVASGEDPKFITNDVTHDPQVHDHDWARRLGLVSFAGYRLLSADGMPIGVLALFSKYAISPDEDVLLEGLANTTAQVVQTAMMEEVLRESEERYRTIFELAADSIVLIDGETGKLVEFNKRAHENLGFTRKEFEKLKIQDFEIIEDTEEVAKHIKTIIDAGADTFETKHRTKSGKIRDIQVSSRAISIRGKNFVQSIWRDITEHKGAEEASRESQKRYKRLWDDAPVAYHMLDTKGVIKQVNQTEIDMLGYTRDEMVDELIFKFVLPEQRKEAEKRFRLKLAGKRLRKRDDRIYVKKDGSKMYVSIDDVLEHDSDGKAIGIRTTMVDISELKRAQEALKKTSEKIKLFAYSVSHDLKSPAIGIYGLAKRVLRDYEDVLDEKAKKYCDQILKAAEQITTLVEMINIYISTKEAPLNIEPVRLQEILQMIKDEFSTQLSIREIKWFQPESVPEMQVDRLSILRAMRNLVDNALKYGGDELSEIRIGYEPSDEFHTLWISNDGEGIKTEDPEKIFELFQRNEGSTGVEGTGLGLAIVKEVAEQHSGKVRVESDPEKGTTFYISVSRHL
jgi:PAS domain S-box-containing protein